MEVNKIIEELEAFIDFYTQTRGGAPVCMLEAIKLLRPYNKGNTAELEQAIKNKVAELRALMQAAGGDYAVLHVGMDSASAHATFYKNFDVYEEPDIVLNAAWYDPQVDPEWLDISSADGWLFEWKEAGNE